MTTDLERFLAEAGARPWKWGEVDCCTVLADWLLLNGRPDLWAPYRGRYDDEASGVALIRAHGDLVAMVTAQAKRIDLPVAKGRGSIGVVGSARHPLRQWGAIYDGKLWLLRVSKGFAPISAAVLAEWGV